MDNFNTDDYYDQVELQPDEEHTELEKELNSILNTKGLRYPSKKRLRNLAVYKDMPEEKFEEEYAKMVMGIRYDREWEKRIQLKLKEFDKDYDLSDLKINDINALRALASATLRLSDYDSTIGQLTAKGVNQQNINLIDKIESIQDKLRLGITKMEDSLKISRKIRKSDEEDSVPAFIEDLKDKARKFYQQKMMYIFCPKCNTLLATTWFLYPDKKNIIELVCHRKVEDNKICGTRVVVDSRTLLASKMSNNHNILPESMR